MTSARHKSDYQIWIVRVGVVGFVCLGIAVLVHRSDEQLRNAPRIKSASNLTLIGQAISRYAKDHGGQYPDTLQTLFLSEGLTPDLFIDPWSNDSVADGPTTRDVAFNLNAGGHNSYVYLGRGLTTTITPADAIIIYEPLANNDGEGMSVLFGDGHVEWKNAAAGMKILAKVRAGAMPIRNVDVQ